MNYPILHCNQGFRSIEGKGPGSSCRFAEEVASGGVFSPPLAPSRAVFQDHDWSAALARPARSVRGGLYLRVRGRPVSARARVPWSRRVLRVSVVRGSPTGSVAERAMWRLRVARRDAALCLVGRRGALPAFPLFSSLARAAGCREPRGGCCRRGPASW